jgi:hypothetical protein
MRQLLDSQLRRLALPSGAKATVMRPSLGNCGPPSVSVVIPCYNYGRYLPACVDSVLGQEGVRVDVLIIDDASSDGSDQIVRRLAARDSRVRSICHSTNRGHIATYNEGFAQIVGDYAVLLSADDLLTPGCLARATSLMEAYPSVGLTYGPVIEFGDGDLPLPRTAAKNWIIWEGHDWIWQRCKVGGNAIKCPEAVLRTSVLRQIGFFRPDFPQAGDFDLWLRSATVADVGYIAGADQGYYRLHSQNMHHSMFDLVDDWSERLRCFDDLFQLGIGESEDADLMCNTARQALARQALSQVIRDTGYRALAGSALGNVVRPWLRGAVGQQSASDYVGFAFKACPRASQLPEWRRVNKLTNSPSRPPKLGPSLIKNISERKARSRFAEWRWRTAGV